MAKDNIYDLIISELILRIAALTTANTTFLSITNSIGSNEVPVGFGGNIIFTSTVENMPTGYTISGTTHTINYPSGAPTTGSSNPLSGPSIAVALASLGDTYTVTSTVTITDGVTPIILNATHVITAVSPAYFGVQPYSVTPTTSALTAMANTSNQFSMTNSGIGRLVLALPLGSPSPVTISDQNGLVYVVANDFSLVTNGGYNFYQLNYDTQLTGANVKLFTISYS